ncbi:glycosyltransferase family 2 protein [Sulfurovum riftiae]|uniref:Glycosyltransferase n=1 Tax=Sulfurovum riftiae TaxID=1630136 RepID=A0A151CHA5_9BACT|nr:glycosyltransferase family 2 protein [Sulfurovum riftiae]KYJ86920.1 glycosyltransferase [Sulfurovum riftiae]
MPLSSPKISIITVAYNAVDTIEETIQSVVSQSYDNVEYIIIDGGSTDGTLDIIKKYEDKIDYWVSERDYGLYHAMNKGLERATGDIIGMINADDYYYDSAFQTVAAHYLPECYDTHIFTADIYHGDERVSGWREENRFNGAFTPHPSMFVSKKIYERIGFYALQYKIASDYDFMYRAFNVHHLEPLYVSEPIAFFRPGGLAAQSRFRAYTEEMLVKVENGQRISKAFPVYLLKLAKFGMGRLFE